MIALSRLIPIAASSLALLGSSTPVAALCGPLALPAPVTPCTQESDDEQVQAAETLLKQLRAEAASLTALVQSDAGKAFLKAVEHLPPPEARTIYRSPSTGRALSPAAASALPEQERSALDEQSFGPETFYLTRYGSPLAYSRPLDLLGAAGVSSWHGLRVLDLGYGTLGHLRTLALAGADARGVDVDSFLKALYCEPGDQGPVAGAANQSSASAPGGRVTLIEGRWPAEPGVVDEVGAGYDVFLSKNTLKRGYIHPAREVDPRMTIDLGVGDEQFLAELHRILKPGGLAMIYNICPPEAAEDEAYIPWADGRSPFTREAWEAAGFELLEFSREDNEATRRQGMLLDWGTAEEVEQEFFAWYTLARKLPNP